MSEPVVVRVDDRVATGGDAIGRLADGRIVFVEGALPGETVAVEVTADKRDFAKGVAVSVLAASPDRVVGPCPHHHAGCGGCPWQDVAVAAQGVLKRRIVVDALARIAHCDVEVLPAPVAVAPAGYRTTLHLAVDGSGRVGYHRRRRHDVVAVGSCLVAHPRLAELLGSLSAPGHRRLSLRTGTADGVRLAVTTGAAPAPAGLPDDVVVVGDGDRAWVRERVGGREWRVSARVFFQSGPQAAEGIVAAVDEALGDAVGPGGRLVDLYAGVGVLGGVAAARRDAGLVAVESDAAAADDARVNLADLDATVVTAEVGRWTPGAADAVIADPARPGLGRPGVAAVVGTGAARVVLVSCDPASLGRDVALLAAAGYRPVTVRLVDAFAHTVHTEVVTRLDLE